MTSHPFDRPFALGESIDTTEAHAYFLVLTQPKQARGNRPIAAAPTAGWRWLDEVATDGSLVHGPKTSARRRRHSGEVDISRSGCADASATRRRPEREMQLAVQQQVDVSLGTVSSTRSWPSALPDAMSSVPHDIAGASPLTK